MKLQQLSLFGPARREHGGDIGKGKRKLARPLVTKRPMHLTLRSSKARGTWSFLKRKGQIHLTMLDTADKFSIKILGFENVGNHLHLIIQGKSRRQIRAFLRVLPQKVMFLVTGAKKGNKQGRFFDQIIYSRIVEWGKDYTNLVSYFGKNAIEALGLTRLHWKTVPSH
jgi:REP element-mobilizing transposase RayT